jgi:hypothetical protein
MHPHPVPHVFLCATLLAGPAAFAQVRSSAEAFPVQPPVEALPLAPFTPLPLAPARPEEDVELVLHKGRPVHDELRAWAQRHGWDLVWEAPSYVVERDLVLFGGFEAAVEAFLKGANEAGTRMRAVFYRGNRTVRVSED